MADSSIPGAKVRVVEFRDVDGGNFQHFVRMTDAEVDDLEAYFKASGFVDQWEVYDVAPHPISYRELVDELDRVRNFFKG